MELVAVVELLGRQQLFLSWLGFCGCVAGVGGGWHAARAVQMLRLDLVSTQRSSRHEYVAHAAERV